MQPTLPSSTHPTTSRWSRFTDRCSIVAYRLILAALLMLAGGVTTELIANRGRPQAAMIEIGGSGPGVIPAHSPTVQFLSASKPLIDVVGPDTLVQVCTTVVDIELNDMVVMVDFQSVPARRLRDALRMVTAMETTGIKLQPDVARQHPQYVPPARAPAMTTTRTPSGVYVESEQELEEIDVDPIPEHKPSNE